MDGWMDGWIDGWMDGWVNGWMGGWMCVCVCVCVGILKSDRRDCNGNQMCLPYIGLVVGDQEETKLSPVELPKFFSTEEIQIIKKIELPKFFSTEEIQIIKKSIQTIYR